MAIPTLNNYAMPSQWKANKVNWSLEPKRAALLIHDMQEYFTAFYGENSPLIAALTERLAAVRKQCKALGIPVFYTAQPKHQSPEDRALLESMAAFAAGVEQMEITHRVLERVGGGADGGPGPHSGLPCHRHHRRRGSLPRAAGPVAAPRSP